MTPARRQLAKRRRLITAALSVAGHAAVLFVLISAQPDPPTAIDPEPMRVELVTLPPPPPPVVTPPAPDPAPPAPPSPAPPKPAPPKPSKPPPRRIAARPARPSPDVAPLLANIGATANGEDEVSEGQLASAARAGAGSGGGDCNMARRLQAALRKDAMVQAAVAEAHRSNGSSGKALLVWNGDWVRRHDQDGNGLAAVREAIMWEVGFAPPACRAERVHGLVLLSLSDGPGSGRIVVGHGDWRWSDLLTLTKRP